MNKTVFVVLVVVAMACLIALYIWSSHNRFYLMRGSEGIAYEVDRKTGESWVLYGTCKIPHECGGVSSKKEMELPYDAARLVTGNGGLFDDLFSGKLYNGSDWTVTRVIISISANEQDGTSRWSRDFSKNVTIQPLTTETFVITVTGAHGIKEAPWNIKKVFGYKKASSGEHGH